MYAYTFVISIQPLLIKNMVHWLLD